MLTCLITGASRGIGLELAQRYAASGATVLATARNPAAATALHALEMAHAHVHIHPLDVAAPASIAALATRLAGRPIDLLVANAGVMGPRGGLDDPANTAALWAEVFAINVTGVFFTARAFTPNVIAATGRIAIVASRMGSSSAAKGTNYVYRASKAAAANIGLNLAAELKPKGVAVGVYHPGWVRTAMGGSAADITVATSAVGLMQRFSQLSLATTGVFEDYKGAPIAF